MILPADFFLGAGCPFLITIMANKRRLLDRQLESIELNLTICPYESGQNKRQELEPPKATDLTECSLNCE